MLTPVVCKLACGCTIKLIPIPLVLEIELLGETEAYKRAAQAIKTEARGFACAEYACRKLTGKPTHYSL